MELKLTANPGPEWALEIRSGLPDALRVLLETFPRGSWEGDPGFDGLVRFWLERHLMFRRLLGTLRHDAERRLDLEDDARTYRHRLSRLGGTFVQELHGHHMIEDHHYFPALAVRDARLSRGFELLDADHHALDGLLKTFADKANAVLDAHDEEASRDAVATFLGSVNHAENLLHRHLTDEEELIVPVILKYGTSGLPG